jgi:hypothetical protein
VGDDKLWEQPEPVLQLKQKLDLQHAMFCDASLIRDASRPQSVSSSRRVGSSRSPQRLLLQERELAGSGILPAGRLEAAYQRALATLQRDEPRRQTLALSSLQGLGLPELGPPSPPIAHRRSPPWTPCAPLRPEELLRLLRVARTHVGLTMPLFSGCTDATLHQLLEGHTVRRRAPRLAGGRALTRAPSAPSQVRRWARHAALLHPSAAVHPQQPLHILVQGYPDLGLNPSTSRGSLPCGCSRLRAPPRDSTLRHTGGATQLQQTLRPPLSVGEAGWCAACARPPRPPSLTPTALWSRGQSERPGPQPALRARRRRRIGWDGAHETAVALGEVITLTLQPPSAALAVVLLEEAALQQSLGLVELHRLLEWERRAEEERERAAQSPLGGLGDEVGLEVAALESLEALWAR